MKKIDTKRFRGSYLFSSQSVCMGFSPSRRDDIQSAFFVLIYLLNGQKLPWSHIFERKDFQSQTTLQTLMERTQSCMQVALLNMVPIQLQKCLQRVLYLRFQEAPPYDYIVQSLKECFEWALALENEGLRVADSAAFHRFEWNRNLSPHVKRNLIQQDKKLRESVDEVVLFRKIDKSMMQELPLN